MRFRKLMLATAAASMTAMPVLAANPAAKLSVAPSSARASAKGQKSDLAGGGGYFVAIIAVIAVVAGIVVVASNDDDPDSR